MKIEQRYTYTYEGFEVEVELRITGDHEVEIDDVFGIKNADGKWVDAFWEPLVRAVAEVSINETLEAEGDAGEWDEVIAETRLDAQEEEPEPTWGHGCWAPARHSVPGAFRVH